MAVEQPGFCFSFEAAADLSAHQFKFVKLDSAGKIAAIAADTDCPCGVLQDKPSALGMAGNVMIDGVTKLQGDADLARGAKIGTSADGQAIALVPGTDTTKYICGQVIEDNTAAGGLITAMIDCFAPHRAS